MSSVPRLAVYGSLQPGRENHYLLAKYPGTWSRGRVRGDLINAGWGAAGGYLGLIPRDDGPWVAVQVFESESLADAWQELDEFEGGEYVVPDGPGLGLELDAHFIDRYRA